MSVWAQISPKTTVLPQYTENGISYTLNSKQLPGNG